jgi:hypothetical protein
VIIERVIIIDCAIEQSRVIIESMEDGGRWMFEEARLMGES